MEKVRRKEIVFQIDPGTTDLFAWIHGYGGTLLDKSGKELENPFEGDIPENLYQTYKDVISEDSDFWFEGELASGIVYTIYLIGDDGLYSADKVSLAHKAIDDSPRTEEEMRETKVSDKRLITILENLIKSNTAKISLF